jgi:mRNA-degrading endonuclease RelE of RelBE toxin-antitoxin system
MKYKVELREQVKSFVDTLAPESRKKIRSGLRGLESEKGDCIALKEKLVGYHRLRIGGYRILFRYRPGKVIECVFAESRSLVYHLFEREVLRNLRHETR